MPPTAPDPIAANFTPTTPSSPGVITLPYSSGGGGGLALGGSISPNTGGPLEPVEFPLTAAWAGTGPQWTSTGQPNPSNVGTWANLYKHLLVTPASGNLSDLAPVANYTATGSQSTASQLSIWTGSDWMIYWLYDQADGNPATAIWVDLADSGLASKNSLSIAAGTMIVGNARKSGVLPGDFSGGLLETWATAPDAVFRWNLLIHYNSFFSYAFFTAEAVSPVGATWTQVSGSTMSPAITGGVAAPDAVAPNGAGSTPTAPAAITEPGSGTSPTAPGAITAAASSATPTAPALIVASGTGSAPTAPGLITPAASGSAPTAPGLITAAASSATPPAPGAIAP